MQHRYKSLLIILIITGVIIILIKSGYIPYDEYNHRQIETFSEINQKYTAHFGYIQPRVVDGFSERPIEGAVVIIPEIDKNSLPTRKASHP